MSAEEQSQSWYVRRGTTVQGPYEVAQLRRYLLLGRVRLTDRVSADGHHWQPLTQRLELIPEEMRDLESEAGRARFEAARKAVDERSAERADEEYRMPSRRGNVPGFGLPSSRAGLGALALVAAVGLAVVGFYGDFGHGQGVAPACDVAPAAAVDWSYCTKDGLQVAAGTDLNGLRAINGSFHEATMAGVNLSGAQLAYASFNGADLRGVDLSGADLRGANLRDCDLSDASLADADLSNADLRGARVRGAEFAGANLIHAVMPDGSACTAGTVGDCLR